MYLYKFWGLVTVYKSNIRLKAVKKKKKACLLGQEESVTLDHWGTSGQWDSWRILLTLISMTWTCWAGFQDEPACGSEVSGPAEGRRTSGGSVDESKTGDQAAI